MSDGAVQGLGQRLRAEFNENTLLRKTFEDRWLLDLAQFKGIYPEDVQKEIAEGRSKVFLRKTATKVNSITARLKDLLFPAKGDRNWSMGPSNTPAVDPGVLREALTMESGRLQRPLSKKEVRALTMDLAEDAAQAMAQEMEDQLSEGPGRTAYRTIADRVLFQGVLYGCGVLKGPLVEKRPRERFVWDPGKVVQGEDGAFVQEPGRWTLGRHEGDYWPFREFVSIWDVYPDLTAITPDDLRFVWQSHLKTRRALLDQSNWPYFNGEAIRDYINNHPDGDATHKAFETELRGLDEPSSGIPSELKGRYRLLERWGHISGNDLAECGISDVDPAETYAANVWLLGDVVVRAVLSPIEGIDIPYYFFFYGEDESQFFPEGVASIMRDPQAAFNAAVRMMLDNGAITAGPQIAVNVSALHEDANPYDLHPFKVWPFKNVADLKQAMHVWTMDSAIGDLLRLATLMADWADEQTTPRFMAGEGASRGAAETASGLSMLMGAANIVLKGLVSQFDDHITRPFITALYYWNMMFSPRAEIKGDYVIKAIGSSALVARELQAERVTKAIQITDNPRFKGRVDDGELLEEIFQSMELNQGCLRSEEEYRRKRHEEMVEAQRASAEAVVQTLMEEARKQGIPLPQALGNMFTSQVKHL
ncbi:MAG: hypothetical protein AB7D57_14655, partial [Desulfovibrionaceae bacterium]